MIIIIKKIYKNIVLITIGLISFLPFMKAQDVVSAACGSAEIDCRGYVYKVDKPPILKKGQPYLERLIKQRLIPIAQQYSITENIFIDIFIDIDENGQITSIKSDQIPLNAKLLLFATAKSIAKDLGAWQPLYLKGKKATKSNLTLTFVIDKIDIFYQIKCECEGVDWNCERMQLYKGTIPF